MNLLFILVWEMLGPANGALLEPAACRLVLGSAANSVQALDILVGVCGLAIS